MKHKRYILHISHLSGDTIESTLVGRRISDIRKLLQAKIPVVDAVILPTTLFKLYISSGSIPEIIAEAVVQAASSLGRDVFVRHSTNKPCVGMADNIVARCDYTNLKYAIEIIYRSWFSERARTQRIIKEISENDSFPAIFIQRYYEDIFSLNTRNSTSGAPTSQENWKYNVSNTARSFTAEHMAFLQKLESALCHPSKVYFIDDGPSSVCSVKDQAIGESALMKVLVRYYEEGFLSTRELLRRIQPSMLGRFRTYRLPPRLVSAQARGLPLTGGFFWGTLALNNGNNIKEVTKSTVLVMDENVQAKDVHLLAAAGGVIVTGGGLTSHVALICRNWSIPAISLQGVTIDANGKCIYMPSGEKARENSVVLLDCNRGIATFSDGGIVEAQYELAEAAEEYDTLLAALVEFESPKALKPLPIEEQIHIAKIKSMARKVGLIL